MENFYRAMTEYEHKLFSPLEDEQEYEEHDSDSEVKAYI